MRSHSDGVRSDVYRIPMLIGESESLYNCKMHDLSSFSQRYHFLNRLLAVYAVGTCVKEPQRRDGHSAAKPQPKRMQPTRFQGLSKFIATCEQLGLLQCRDKRKGAGHVCLREHRVSAVCRAFVQLHG